MKNNGRMANGADPDQTNPEEHSDQGLHCMPLLYCLSTIFLWLKDRFFYLPKQSQKSRLVVGLFRKGKTHNKIAGLI